MVPSSGKSLKNAKGLKSKTMKDLGVIGFLGLCFLDAQRPRSLLERHPSNFGVLEGEQGYTRLEESTRS
jgi:hypothetical protein